MTTVMKLGGAGFRKVIVGPGESIDDLSNPWSEYVQRDTDGDGVLDEFDLFPDDPTRSTTFRVDLITTSAEIESLLNLEPGTVAYATDTGGLYVFNLVSGTPVWSIFEPDVPIV